MNDISIFEWLFLGMPWELVVLVAVVGVIYWIYGTLLERRNHRWQEKMYGPLEQRGEKPPPPAGS